VVTDDYPEIGLPDPYKEARKHFPNHLGGAYWTSGPGNRVVLKVTEVGPNNEEVTIEVPYEVFCITIPSRMFNISGINIFTDDKEVVSNLTKCLEAWREAEECVIRILKEHGAL